MPMHDASTSREVHVAIVGTGFSGLGAAIRLRQAGIEDMVLLERASALGGVWRDNTYPGCACDVESHLYEFSWAPNPGWTRRYAGQEEIWAYLRDLHDRFELGPFVRYGEDVTDATWDASARRWRITTSRGRYAARVLVAATGALAEPRMPDLPGLDRFPGPAFHSAEWDHSVRLEGRTVALLGSGASAAQIVPAIQPVVGRLLVFQRTPAWVVPRHDRAVGPRRRALYRRFPALQRARRLSILGRREMLGVAFRHPPVMRSLSFIVRRHLQRSVSDPDLRARLTPTYTPGCKRILVSDDYLPALTRPNVEVIPAGAATVDADTIVAADGTRRQADVLVCATGFGATEFVIARRIRGRDGRTLSDTWGASPRAHLGTTAAGFPNLFLIPGPSTGLGHSSVILMFEAQIEHLVNAVRWMERHDVAAVEPEPEVQERFIAEVDRRMARTVWMTGCRSWYLDGTGRNSTLWPGTPGQFRRRVCAFRREDYVLDRV